MLQLTQHDSRLVTAAITYLLAITGSGSEGATALLQIRNKDTRKALRDATALLTVSTEGMDTADSPEIWADNLERLQEIARNLLGVTEVELEPVRSMEPVNKDGEPIGPKHYELWLTHEQIHLVHWAVKFAESAISFDPVGLSEAVEVYNDLRERELETFVTKFNQVHEVARQDDGETSVSTDITTEGV
jgi:hypothetical protein